MKTFNESQVIELITKAFNSGRNWGEIYSGWFIASPEDHKEKLEQCLKSLLRAENSEDVVGFTKAEREDAPNGALRADRESQAEACESEDKSDPIGKINNSESLGVTLDWEKGMDHPYIKCKNGI